MLTHNMENAFSVYLPPVEAEQESPRLYFDTVKSGLVRIIKSYRAVKPEMSVTMCFFRYAGIVGGRRTARAKNDTTTKDKDKKEEVTVKSWVRDVVHMLMLFLSDLTPEPISTMMRMMTDMWSMSRDMYKSVKKDEMGSCSLEYMSKRFWWWLGI